MNCEQCQELISPFLDNELEITVSLSIQTHLTVCAECAAVCEDFASILDFCGETPTSELIPPNSQALWCRISNIIESDIQAEIDKEKKVETAVAPVKKGFLGGRSWQFSFSQVASVILGVALISSLLTVVGIHNYSTPDEISSNSSERSVFQRILGKIGLVETPQATRERRVKERLAAIDYWNQRVEVRRAQWDAQLRDAFDRNLNEINKSVFEYNHILETNPQDDLSGEMLDTTLNEKMELLREFAEL